MVFVQCLLLGIGLVLAGGLFAVCVMLNGILRNQAQSIATLRQLRTELLGEYFDGALYGLADNLGKVAKFADDARRGRIPNLRYDDWYATTEDLKRWERAEIMAAASA